MLSSKKSSSKRPTQKKKLKRASPEGSCTLKISRADKSNRGARTKRKIRTTQQHDESLKEVESKDNVRDSAVVLLEQGGGVVRMRPESSEDEDVDVEDDSVGDNHPDRSLIGQDL